MVYNIYSWYIIYYSLIYFLEFQSIENLKYSLLLFAVAVGFIHLFSISILYHLIFFIPFSFQFTQQIALAGFVEFTFHLTRLNPEMINIARDSGNVTFNFFKFDIDDTKGELSNFLFVSYFVHFCK